MRTPLLGYNCGWVLMFIQVFKLFASFSRLGSTA
jgi:hypothetical protein